jgi:hypothetical protein
VNVAAIAGLHWESEKLFVHLTGGRFVSLTGVDAKQLWAAVESLSLDLRQQNVEDDS